MNILKEELKDAICNSDIDFLLFHKHKYNINERFEDENNDTLSLYSLSDPDSSAYLFFLENGAMPDMKNDDGEGAIHSVVYSGDENRLNQVFKYQDNLDIDLQSNEGTTPLLLSILLEKVEIFFHLIRKGANVNIADFKGITPMHAACIVGKIEFVQTLIENGADLTVKSKRGNYPFALAVNGDFIDIIHLLYKKIY